MTGGTHVAVGITCSLAILQPKTIPECLCAITGGMIGGMISDIDSPGKRKSMDYRDDPYGWQVYCFVGVALVFLLTLDFFAGEGAVDFFLTHIGPPLFVGIVAFLGLCFYGAHTPHRSFTHSILAGMLFTLSVWCFCEPLALSFAIGFSSHLIIDFFNRKKVQYLWPIIKKPFGLNRYPSDGKFNDTLGAIGTLASIYLSAYFIITSFAKSALHEKILTFFSSPVSIFGQMTLPLIVPYLIIVNIVGFIAYTLDHYLYMNGMGFYSGSDEQASTMAEFILTLLLIIDISGGMLGKLLAVFVILKGKIYKDKWRANYNFYIIPCCILICWLIIVFTLFLPATTSWAKPIASLRFGGLPIQYFVLGYFLIINIITIVFIQRMEQTVNVITPREMRCMVLCLLGGASGCDLSMAITGKHQNASMLASTLPEMIVMHAIIMTCVFFMA